MADSEKKTVSLRDLIIGANDIESEVITVPQWGDVKLEVRGMSGRERAALLKKAVGKDGEPDLEVLYPLLLINTVHDPETGEKVFTEKDVQALNNKSGAALERVAQVSSRLSGLDDAGVKDMGKSSSQDTNSSTENEDSSST